MDGMGGNGGELEALANAAPGGDGKRVGFAPCVMVAIGVAGRRAVEPTDPAEAVLDGFAGAGDRPWRGQARRRPAPVAPSPAGALSGW